MRNEGSAIVIGRIISGGLLEKTGGNKNCTVSFLSPLSSLIILLFSLLFLQVFSMRVMSSYQLMV